MQVTDAFCRALRGIELSGRDYGTCLHDVALGLDMWLADGAEGLSEEAALPIRRLATGLQVWEKTMAHVCERTIA
jgi:hypothetical protein